jgi:sec-independent protein translocase protein TatC
MFARPIRRRRAANPDARMPVMDHLRELRRRLITVVVIIAAGAVLGWLLYPHTLDFLRHPYCSVPHKYRYSPNGTRCVLIYHGALEGFTTRLQVSAISGAVFTAPLWLYQIWAFVTPGLRRNERKYTIVFVVSSTLLFVGGMALAYVVLSKGLRFLLEAAGSGTQAQLTVGQYIGFVVMMLAIFGAAFELPLIVVMVNFAGVLSAKLLRKSQRIAIFLIFLFAAVATPSTDPFTMCAMALPMVVLFEAAVLIASVHDRRKARREAEAAESAKIEDHVPSDVEAIPEPIDSAWSDST